MRSKCEQKDPLPLPKYREFRALSEVEANPDMTQRDLSRRLEIALGLTNILVRNLIQKGYIRVVKASWKRRLYALTPEGFSRKIHLAVAYVAKVMHHYRQVRHTLREQIAPLNLNKESRVAIYGTGEFAELVYLGLRDIGVEEIEIFNATNGNAAKFLGLDVHDISEISVEFYDKVIVGDLYRRHSLDTEFPELNLDSPKVVELFSQKKGGKGK